MLAAGRTSEHSRVALLWRTCPEAASFHVAAAAAARGSSTARGASARGEARAFLRFRPDAAASAAVLFVCSDPGSSGSVPPSGWGGSVLARGSSRFRSFFPEMLLLLLGPVLSLWRPLAAAPAAGGGRPEPGPEPGPGVVSSARGLVLMTTEPVLFALSGCFTDFLPHSVAFPVGTIPFQTFVIPGGITRSSRSVIEASDQPIRAAAVVEGVTWGFWTSRDQRTRFCSPEASGGFVKPGLKSVRTRIVERWGSWSGCTPARVHLLPELRVSAHVRVLLTSSPETCWDTGLVLLVWCCC